MTEEQVRELLIKFLEYYEGIKIDKDKANQVDGYYYHINEIDNFIKEEQK